MDYREFLFEIGVEDLPPGFVRHGREHIQRTVPELFKRHRIECEGLSVYGAPRRLAFAIGSCAERQSDLEQVAHGPALRVAYDADGKPTKAAIGFARSAGVPVEELGSAKSDKGEYVTARKVLAGRPTVEVLPEIIASLVESFSFPKMMRWTTERFSFGRPVRWLVALFGDEAVKCSVFGVESSNVSRSIWTEGAEGIRIAEAGSYMSDMAAHYIAVSHECRIDCIRAGIKRIEEKLGCEVVCDEEMLSILADSVDSPQVTFGDFDARFLALPEPVLTTCLWHHQYFLATKPRFFSEASGGFDVDRQYSRLLPHFAALLANPRAKEEIVRRGNEAVLEARLEDAAFFFAEDKKTGLEELLPKLQGMVLHKGLGDLLMKSRRLARLAPELASLVFAGQEQVDGMTLDAFKACCGRAGELCKADLVTHTVGEFPELQGVMGGIYARFHGEADAISEAISEHYQPRGVDDKPPETSCGRVLALADKLDSLCAFFGAGLIPKGSQDPFGLRRDAQGIVSILLEAGRKCPLLPAIGAAIEKVHADGLIKPADDLDQQVLSFVKQRLSFSLANRESLRQDLVAAVISHPCDDIVDLRSRALALQQFSLDEQFEALTTGLKRASNILKGQAWGELNHELLVEAQEQRLFEEIVKIEDDVYRSIAGCKYLDAFRLIAGLRPFIDDFFDHVMVMVEDESVRRNRLALLARLTKMFGSIADFSKIVVERK
ncbi:MAG: glycine--tRNA ligase subunit beta [Candidatus Coatesbacteria bacterium]|nr:glycine--tRNA ligase subunit beta [Candidatus Coatesbacteria bacterium]